MKIIPIPTKEQMKALESQSKALRLKLVDNGQNPEFAQKQMKFFRLDIIDFNSSKKYVMKPKYTLFQELKIIAGMAVKKLASVIRK